MSKPTPAKATNWAARTKTATEGIPLNKPFSPIDRGTRYEGIIIDAIPTVFSTGSFGIKMKYEVNGIERPVYENLVLFTLGNEGQQVATKFGESTLKRRLTAAGYDSNAVNTFKLPRTQKDAGNLEGLKGKGVAVYLVTEEYMGKTQFKVKSVWPLEDNR